MGLADILQSASAPASTSPSPSPAPAPVVQSAPTPAASTVPPAAADTALGGGSRLAQIRQNLRTASLSAQKDELPMGTGWYLIKNAVFKITQKKSVPMTVFSVICLKAIKDGDGLAPGTPGYSGAIPGDEYTVPYWHGGLYESQNTVNLLGAIMGWSKDKLKEFQATDEGLDVLIELMRSITCYDMVNFKGTGQPCGVANQVVVQLSKKMNLKEVKSADGQPLYNAKGEVEKKSFENVYWDKKIFTSQLAEIPEDTLVNAFGSVEAIQEAVATENSLASLSV